MRTRENVIAALRTIKPEIEARFKLRSMALFGSYARNEQTEASDVDLLVDVDPTIGLDFVDMADMIERHLGVKTDVVPVDGVKSRYRRFIAKDMVYV